MLVTIGPFRHRPDIWKRDRPRLDKQIPDDNLSSLINSHILSKLANVSVGPSLIQTPGEIQFDLGNPPDYEANSMQIAAFSKTKEVDIEAQGHDLVNEQSSAKSQRIDDFGFNPTPCKRACSCACHGVYRVKTPSMLQSLVGSLIIKHNGLCGLNQACNEHSCRRRSSASIKISYRFPDWLINRIISSVIISNKLNGPQLSLVVPRVVPSTSDIFFHTFAGNIEGVARLFQAGLASPNDISDSWGYTPLHYAVDRGHIDLCRFLLKAGARSDIIDIQESSVTDLAWNKICSKRIPAGYAVELEEVFDKDDWFEERQFTILHKIVLDLLPTRRSLEQELSISTSNIDTADSEGRTPLSWAAETDNGSAVEILLQYNASMKSKSLTGMTPLHYAARAPNSICLSILLKKACPVSLKNKYNQSPLNIAAYFKNDPSFINLLLDHGSDIHERDAYRSTAIGCAIFMNRDATARCLLSRGANIADQNKPGFTCANDSIENNSHECIALILDSNADLSAVDVQGENALHVVSRRGDLRTTEIFQAAAEAGKLDNIDTTAKTSMGFTVWDLFRQRSDMDENVQRAFRDLMMTLDSRNVCPPTYCGVLETLPPMDVFGIEKDARAVEVTVNEVLVE